MKVEERLITSEELGRERQRLIQAGIPDEAPEFDALWKRVSERDEFLFETYGRPFLDSDPGRWIAISIDGRTFLGNTSGEASWAAKDAVGAGNYALRKLAAFPGYEIYH